MPDSRRAKTSFTAGELAPEMLGRGVDVTYDAVLADIHARDARDTGRADAPLLRATDALLLDNTTLDRDAAVAAAIAFVVGRVGKPG